MHFCIESATPIVINTFCGTISVGSRLARSAYSWIATITLVSIVFSSMFVEVQAQRVWVWTDRYYYNLGDTVFIYMRSSVNLANSRLTITHSNGYQSQTWMGAMSASVIKVYYGSTSWGGHRQVRFEGWPVGGGYLVDYTSYFVSGTGPWPPVTTVTETTTLTTTTIAPDFKIDVTPPSNVVKLGGTATFTVTVSSIGSFSSDVYIEVSGSPAIPPGSSFATPNPIRPSPDDSQRATLTINTGNFGSGGTYTLTVSGRSGSTVRTAVVQLEVKDPTITLSVLPASQNVEQGQSAQFTIDVRAEEYKGTVSVAVGGLPPGATHTVSPPSLTGSGQVILTVMTTDQTSSGTYSIQVTATAGGGRAHAPVLLTVTLPWWKRAENLALILVVAVALAALTAWIVFRRKPAPPSMAPTVPAAVSYPAVRPATTSYTPVLRPASGPTISTVGSGGAAICFGCGSTIPAGITMCPRCGKPR